LFAAARSRLSSGCFGKRLSGFPATQPFVDQFNGDAQILANAFCEADCFRGHFAASAAKLQRPSDHDEADFQFAA
jgi:hypothetical protein